MPNIPPATPAFPGTQQSALDLISSALRLIGVKASGEQPTGNEANDALAVLNQMIDSAMNDSLMIYSVSRLVFTLTPGKQAYTIGPGLDFATPTPQVIEYASIIDLTNPGQPLEIPIEYTTAEQKWQEMIVKNLSTQLPVFVYDDMGNSRTLSFWPIPNLPQQAVLYAWLLLAQFPDLATTVTFPRGYYEAIRFNLAIRLAPEYGAVVSQEIAAIANESLARIKSFNLPEMSMRCDGAVLAQGGTRYPGLLGVISGQ